MADDNKAPDSVLPPQAVEKPTTYNKRAQIVAIALVCIVMLGLVVQTTVNMKHRAARNEKAELAADQQPTVAAAASPTKSFKEQQDQATRDLAATNAKTADDTKRQRMLAAISGRTEATADVPGEPGGEGNGGRGERRPTLSQVSEDFRLEETKRVLMAGREGFGKGDAASPSAATPGQGANTSSLLPPGIAAALSSRQATGAPGQATAPQSGNASEIARAEQLISDGQSRAAQARSEAARLQDMLRQKFGDAANAMMPAGTAGQGAGGGAALLPVAAPAPRSPSANPAANPSSLNFGEAGQNRAFRDPSNAGPRDGEMLMPTGTIASGALKFDSMSDYEGDWEGELQRPVYDLSGEWILLPTGTKVVGKTVRSTSVNEVIQNRMGYTVQWAIRPDGKRIDLRRTAGMDSAGVAALKDQVDYHVAAQMFGVLAYAVVGLGPSLSASDGQALSSKDQAVADATGQTRSIGRSFATKYLSIVPTITIRAGAPIKIFFEDDIYVTPWAPVDARFYSSRE